LILVFGAKKRLKMEGALSVIKALLIKTDVKNIMDGGEAAFKIRAEKYGGI